MMGWMTSLSQLSLALLGIASVGTALPTNTTLVERQGKDCYDLDLLTIEFLYDNNCYDPLASTCLFYTSYQSLAARVFSKKNGAQFTTIWDMWDVEYYDPDTKDENNVMRCIFMDEAMRQTYFERMSTAMALKCDVFSTVMSAQTIDEVPKDGIWYKQEYPTLMNTPDQNKANNNWLPASYDNQVDSIDYISAPDGDNNEVYWTRGDENPRRRDTFGVEGAGIARRQSACGAPDDTASAFDMGGALPVKW